MFQCMCVLKLRLLSVHLVHRSCGFICGDGVNMIDWLAY